MALTVGEEDFIAREMQALKQLRRISTSQGGPGALTLDPDLPPTAAGAAPHWTSEGDPSASGSQSPTEEDSSHLFWVPAHLHPELAPQEFRAFLKEHARTPPDGSEDDSISHLGEASAPGSPLSRSPSSHSGLGRRKSMLSRQYKPAVGDGVEEEKVVESRPTRRKSIYDHVNHLTIKDFQKLEELAEEASKSDDPAKLRSVLRRSMSLTTPSMIDQMDNIDDADRPVIVPRPGQILQRAARTKIRKPGLPGDGGGHRFASTRRGQARSQTMDATKSPRPPSDVSSVSDAGDDVFPPRPSAPIGGAGDYVTEDDDSRPVSFSEESNIFDAYARPDSTSSLTEEDYSIFSSTLPDQQRRKSPSPELDLSLSLPSSGSPPRPSTSHGLPPGVPSGAELALHHPIPQRHLDVPGGGTASGSGPSRTPSPGSYISPPSSPDHLSVGGPATTTKTSPTATSSELPGTVTPTPTAPAPTKSKKGGLFGWGGSSKEDKSSTKKLNKKQGEKEKEKESKGGIISSLFGGGGSKKKNASEDGAPSSSLSGGQAAAAALLGPSKSLAASQSQIQLQPGGPYARYPIHVERAVYRLSHIKLANPRRPLYEQVLISNLMFWYLGIINKSQAPAIPTQPTTAVSPSQNLAAVQAEQAEKEALERQRTEQQMLVQQQQQQQQEDFERAERERAERERKEMEKVEKERQERLQEKTGRRKSLTKDRAPGAKRASEMPVKGVQYDVQHRQMQNEQHYNGGMQQQQFYYAPPPPEAYAAQMAGVGLPPGAMVPAAFDPARMDTGAGGLASSSSLHVSSRISEEFGGQHQRTSGDSATYPGHRPTASLPAVSSPQQYGGGGQQRRAGGSGEYPMHSYAQPQDYSMHHDYGQDYNGANGPSSYAYSNGNGSSYPGQGGSTSPPQSARQRSPPPSNGKRGGGYNDAPPVPAINTPNRAASVGAPRSPPSSMGAQIPRTSASVGGNRPQNTRPSTAGAGYGSAPPSHFGGSNYGGPGSFDPRNGSGQGGGAQGGTGPGKLKKQHSANPSLPDLRRRKSSGDGGDEDVPLAFVQQQQHQHQQRR